ncbi:MAG: sugar transferase [Candidatus Andersenbacteria bacterium]
MKRSELFFGAILVPLDFIALLIAGALAYYLRTSGPIQELRPATFELDLPLTEYIQLVAVVAAVIIIIFAVQGLYTLQVTRKALDEFTKIFSGISIGIMLVVLYIFLSAELFQSRFILLAAYGFAIIMVSFGRYFVKRMQQVLLRRGMGVHRVVLAGNGKFATQLTELFKRRPDLGYKVVGDIETITWSALEDVYRRQGIDEVIQTNPNMTETDNVVVLDFCEQYKVDYKYIPNTFEAHSVNVRFRQVGPIPLLELQRTPLEGWGRIAKRTTDIIGAALGITFLSPVFLVTTLLIKRESPGPVFYRQIRIGKNMKPFEIFKFRSMYLEYCVGARYGGKAAEKKYEELRQRMNERKDGPLFKMKDDPRITKVGRAIRRLRIDELPQLFNVLVGDMSLFGPRPHLPEEVQKYDKHHRKLFTLKPGMSGMAQVAGNAGLPFKEEARLDIAYIENWSLWLDIVLLLKTLRIVFTDKNAV